jgi:dihydrodipicolinate synthase/N-acetylneuraminate lyase
MLFALFGIDGQLDRTAMKKQVEAMVRSGAHGIAVLG